MKSPELLYTQEARYLIRKLHPEVRPATRALIEEVKTDPSFGKSLKGPLANFRSARYGRYRVIYEYQDQQHSIVIHYVGIRKNVYELFEALLQKSKF